MARPLMWPARTHKPLPRATAALPLACSRPLRRPSNLCTQRQLPCSPHVVGTAGQVAAAATSRGGGQAKFNWEFNWEQAGQPAGRQAAKQSHKQAGGLAGQGAARRGRPLNQAPSSARAIPQSEQLPDDAEAAILAPSALTYTP